jgi:SM-20-related protein
MTIQTINLEALRAAPVAQEPFPYIILPNFIRPEVIAGVEADYPDVDLPGSFPLGTVRYGGNFKNLMDDIQGPEMTAVMAQKFGLNLKDKPTMITVRGRTDENDGQIHTDSKTKLITVLIYMNGKWEKPGGRLRLLCSPDNLNDMVAEVPPDQGTLLAFRNQPNAWHGHEQFVGPRRAVQLNWVRDRGVVWREQLRHRLSAFMKRKNRKM